MVFLTATALATSCFLIGVLFTTLLWDSSVLYGLTAPITHAQIEAVETYYLTWWNGAMAVKIFLHIVMLTLFLSLVAKWARKSATAYYFSGASLILLIFTASLYIIITLPSLRLIAADPLNKAAQIVPGADFFTRMQAYFASRNSGALGDRARANAAALAAHTSMTWDERVQHVQVMCAANTIAMALLAGVVLLQVSEWYLDETLIKEAEEEGRAFDAANAASTIPEQPAVAAPKAKVSTPVKVTKEKKKQ